MTASPGTGGEPGTEVDHAFDLAALAEADDDGGDEQVRRVGVHMRVETNAGGDDAGPDVGAVVDVDVAIGAELARLPGAVEVEMRDAFRRKGIAEDRSSRRMSRSPTDPGLPAGMGEVLERAGDIEGVACCRRGCAR